MTYFLYIYENDIKVLRTNYDPQAWEKAKRCIVAFVTFWLK